MKDLAHEAGKDIVAVEIKRSHIATITAKQNAHGKSLV